MTVVLVDSPFRLIALPLDKGLSVLLDLVSNRPVANFVDLHKYVDPRSVPIEERGVSLAQVRN